MERLTNKHEADQQRRNYEKRLEQGYPRNIPEERFLRLAAYEDTGLEPEEIKTAFNEGALLKLTAQYLGTTPDRLIELTQADKEGRLVALPCKVGDTVYSTLDDLGHSYKCEVTGVYLSRREHESYVELDPISYRGSKYGASFGAFGKTVFLTREEAEAALAGEGGKHETD